jgi:(p)ppGpp synthase/HD superfamily hydrolase
MDPLRWAKFFAVVKHGNQTYSGCLPYSHHLAAVEAVLRRFGVDMQYFLEAAWLHDVVEDTNTKLKEIYEFFGPEVADLVGAVTNEPGANRKIRGMLTYPKIRAVKGATRLKLADRIANVEQGGKLVDMYRKEYEDFKRNLFVAGENEDMWNHLDGIMKEEA